MIYFIKCAEYVKIGYTEKSLGRRLQDMQVGNPIELEVLGIIDGDIPAERAIHDRFGKFHVRGEWFRMVPSIQRFMTERLAQTASDVDRENRSQWAMQAGRIMERVLAQQSDTLV